MTRVRENDRGRRGAGAASALALMAGLLLILAAPVQADGTVVPGLSTESEAGDINSAGAIVGSTRDEVSGNYRGFLRSGGQTTLLGSTEPGVNTYAGEINDAGRIAGEVRQSGATRATTWDPDGTQQDLHPAGWGESAVVDLNEAGQVLLSHVDPADGPPFAGAVWSPGGEVDTLAPWDGATGVALRDVNDAGVVVGNLWFGESSSRGFVWDPDGGAPQEITPPGDGRFLVSAINDDGEVAGVLLRPGAEDRAAVWSAGGFTEIPLAGTSYQQVRTISETGTVLLTSDLGAFAWTPGVSLLRIAGLGGGTVYPLAVNDAGTVVGMAATVGRGMQAFSWDPVNGTVELGSPEGSSDARAINQAGVSVGTSRAGATSWQPTVNVPRAPTQPRGVLAAAGDGALLASWSDPLDNGGLWLEYEVVATPVGGGAPVSQTVQALKEGSHDVTLTGLSNDTDYVVTVVARSSAGSSAPAQAPAAVTPRAGASLPTTLVSGEATPESGGRVNTGFPITEDEPVYTGVQVPGGTEGGPIVVAEGPVDLTAPSQYSFLGQQVQITAPAGSAESPLQLTFVLHSSLLAGLDDPSAVQVFRTADGSSTPVAVPDCDEPWSSATPDPCVTGRYYDDPAEGGSGDLYLTVLTSHASAWNFGVASETRPFEFAGFFAPVDPEPTVNVVKAGRTVPVTFSLGGDRGLDVLGGAPSSERHACLRRAPTDAVEWTVKGPGGGQLTYDAATDRYTYAWGTSKGFADQCRTFTLELSDGTTHTAEFKFR